MNSKKIKSKYTNESFVPVKSITNGMIILDNNEKVTGIKIMPRNIFIADQDTQNAIIANLRNVYNMIDNSKISNTIQVYHYPPEIPKEEGEVEQENQES